MFLVVVLCSSTESTSTPLPNTSHGSRITGPEDYELHFYVSEWECTSVVPIGFQPDPQKIDPLAATPGPPNQTEGGGGQEPQPPGAFVAGNLRIGTGI